MDVRGQQLNIALLFAPPSALCGYALYIKRHALLPHADRPQNMAHGAGGVYRLGNAYIPCVYTDFHLPGLYAAKLCWEYVERDRRNPRLLLNPGQRQRFWLRMGL